MKDKVSIVIIGRNEARGIEKCVRAAQTAAQQIGGAEIIYVDSASTDETVKIVESLGVRVLPLDSSLRRCPSAGRFAGSNAASGEFVLFLDADTHIYQDFLPAALEHFQKNPELAGVNGQIDDTDESGVFFDGVEDRFETITEVEWLRGPACFYRRAALLAAGTFNPNLIVEEEAELGLRLLKNNWRLNLLPIKMARHTRCFHTQTFSSVLDALRRDYTSGRLGEIVNTIFCAARQGFGWRFGWLRLKTTICFAFWMISMFISAAFLPLFGASFIVSGMILVMGLAAIRVKKRSFYQTMVFCSVKILTLAELIFGITKLNYKYSAAMPISDDIVRVKGDCNLTLKIK